jgi:non-ribosomal peptide synthetase component F
MYTSGSTGTPKGVVIPHRAVVRLACATDYVQLSAADTVAHLSNPAFDAATFEIWGSLLNGARIAVVPRDAVLSLSGFTEALDRHGVTTMFLTTALFNQIARDAPAALTRRQVLFGGEAVEPRWVAAALRDGRPSRLLHVYGPTETTTFATWHEIRDVDPRAATIPIGRPIANTEVYLLDANGEPVPPGVPGEIHIGGPGSRSATSSVPSSPRSGSSRIRSNGHRARGFTGPATARAIAMTARSSSRGASIGS